MPTNTAPDALLSAAERAALLPAAEREGHRVYATMRVLDALHLRGLITVPKVRGASQERVYAYLTDKGLSLARA